MPVRAGVVSPVVGRGSQLGDHRLFRHVQGMQVLIPGQGTAPALHTAPEFVVVGAEVRFGADTQEIACFAQRVIDLIAVADGNNRDIPALRSGNHREVFQHGGHGCNLTGTPQVLAFQCFQAAAGNIVRRLTAAEEHGAEQRAADKAFPDLTGEEVFRGNDSVAVVLADFALGRQVRKQGIRRAGPAFRGGGADKHNRGRVLAGNIGQAGAFRVVQRAARVAVFVIEYDEVGRLVAVIDYGGIRLPERNIHQRAERIESIAPEFTAARQF